MNRLLLSVWHMDDNAMGTLGAIFDTLSIRDIVHLRILSRLTVICIDTYLASKYQIEDTLVQYSLSRHKVHYFHVMQEFSGAVLSGSAVLGFLLRTAQDPFIPLDIYVDHLVSILLGFFFIDDGFTYDPEQVDQKHALHMDWRFRCKIMTKGTGASHSSYLEYSFYKDHSHIRICGTTRGILDAVFHQESCKYFSF